MAQITHYEKNSAGLETEMPLLALTATIALALGALEVFLYSWLNSSNFAFGSTALYGNGALIVPTVALPVYTLVASYLGWLGYSRFGTWLAVLAVFLVFVTSLVLGGGVLALGWGQLGY